MADSVVMPYIIMAAVLFLLGILIRKAPLPHVEAEPIDEPNNGETSKTSIFQFPHLWLGVVALFVYVGAEVIAGDTIIAYGISLGISGDEAKYFTTFTLMAMVATYGLGIFLIPKYISQAFALKASAILGIVLTFCIVFTTGFMSILFVAILGVLQFVSTSKNYVAGVVLLLSLVSWDLADSSNESTLMSFNF